MIHSVFSFIQRKKIIAIALLICIAAFVLLDNIATCNFYQFEKSDTEFYSSCTEQEYLGMTESEYTDFVSNNNRYSEYWLGTRIRNNAPFAICCANPELVNRQDGVWFDTGSLFNDAQEILPDETYECNLRIVIKSEGMTDQQIDRLIKHLKVRISVYTCSVIFLGFKTIAFA